MHGLFDNAASFDLLAANLDDVPALLAIDLPGHGLSSHFAKGQSWSYTGMMTAVRFLVKQHFKWPTAYLLGHSYGSTLALSYAGLFPSETSLMINIDCARAHNAASNEETLTSMKRNAERLLAIEQKPASKKTMTYEEAVQKMFTNRKHRLTLEQCESLASRSLTNIGGGRYVFNEDLRMSVPSIGRNTFHQFDVLVENARCPVLNIVASEGLLIGNCMAIVKKHLEVMRKNCPAVENQVFIGGHHIHMDKPQEVAAAIDQFWRTSAQFRQEVSLENAA